MNIKFIKKDKGFTLLEIMIVVSMLAIISGSVFFSYNKILDDNSLYDASERILFVMQQTIEESKQNVGDSKHGVYFNTGDSEYYSFTGDEYSKAIESRTYSLPDRIEISMVRFYNEMGNFYNEVTFAQGTGRPNFSNGVIVIRIAERPEKTVTFNMNSEGIWSTTENL